MWNLAHREEITVRGRTQTVYNLYGYCHVRLS